MNTHTNTCNSGPARRNSGFGKMLSFVERRVAFILLAITCCIAGSGTGRAESSTSEQDAQNAAKTQKNKKKTAVTILSPANKSVIKSASVTLKIGFANGADPNKFKALLNGVDISSQFGPVSGGT